MKRKSTVSLAALTLLAGWYVWPLLDTRPEQDDCSFGDVSNAEYREVLSAVRELANNKWGRLPFNRDGVVGYDERIKLGRLIEDRIKRFSDRYHTMDGKVAAMHAVLRGGYGARYWSEMPLNSSERQVFRYVIHKAKIIDLCWWSCWFPSTRWVEIETRVSEKEFLSSSGDPGAGVLFWTFGTLKGRELTKSDYARCPKVRVQLRDKTRSTSQ